MEGTKEATEDGGGGGEEEEDGEPPEAKEKFILEPVQEPEVVPSQYKGILLALLSGCLFSSCGLIAKSLKHLHVLSIGLFRFSGMALLSIPFLLTTIYNRSSSSSSSILEPVWPPNDPQKRKRLAVLLGRGVVGTLAVSSYFASVQYIPVADAAVIGSCTNVLVALGAHCVLGEACGFIPILCAGLTVLGVGIIAQPPLLTGKGEFELDTLIGTALSLGRVLFTSTAIIFVRYLRSLDSSLVIFVLGLLQFCLNLGVGGALGVITLPQGAVDWALLLTLGLFSFGSQWLLTEALKYEAAGPFVIVRSSSDTGFAFVLQFIFFGTLPGVHSGIGAALVTAGVSLVVLRKWVLSLPLQHKSRKTYRFLLK